MSKRSHTFITVITQIRTFSLDFSIKNVKTTKYCLERYFQIKYEYQKNVFFEFFRKTLRSNLNVVINNEESLKSILVFVLTLGDAVTSISA